MQKTFPAVERDNFIHACPVRVGNGTLLKHLINGRFGGLVALAGIAQRELKGMRQIPSIFLLAQ